MRIVDADDAVNRFEELKPKGSSLDVRYAYGISVGLEMAKHVTMSELSTVDAAPVVRCKDCRFSDWYTAVDGKRYCYCMETGASGRVENDFCSYGERDGDGNG